MSKTVGPIEQLEQRVLLSAAPVTIRDPGNVALSTQMGGKTYFEESATSLYVTNGTAGGTFFIHDFDSIEGMTAVDGKLFITADSGVWTSDGTPAGTTLILPMFDNIGGTGRASDFTEFDGSIFFFASVRNVGGGIWKTDGTAAGTTFVKSIQSVENLTPVNGTLFFIGGDDSHGRELWKTDGTEAGTVLVRDMYPGPASGITQSFYDPMAAVDGKLFFVAGDTNLVQLGLWTSDGTANGTVRISDPSVRVVGELTPFNGQMYFSGYDGSGAPSLWKSDGSAAGTSLVKALSSSTDVGMPWMPTVVGDSLYFISSNTATGSDLWKSDGTTDGTALVDIPTGWHQLLNLTDAGQTLAFTLQDARFSPTTYSLWTTDGTSAGTLKVRQTFTSGTRYGPGLVGAVGTIVLFGADDGSGQSELLAYQTDATPPVPEAQAQGPAPYIVDEGASLNLHGFTSAEPLPDRPLTYEWDLDQDGIFGETGASAARGDEIGTDSTFSAAGLDGPGTWTVSFRITDPTGYVSTDSATIAIQNAVPVLEVTGGPSTLVEGNPYTLNLGVDDPGPDTISQWVVNWGDGQVQTLAGDTPSVQHNYPAGPGTYGILVQATDEDGTYSLEKSAAFDGSFGTNGRVLSMEGSTEDRPRDVVVQPDGKIVTLSDVQSDSLSNHDHTLVSRYNADGTLDSTFGDQGRLLFNLNRYGIGEGPTAIALQPDGRIVVAGEFHDSILPYEDGASTFLLRLLPDGSLDPSFGQAGWASYALGAMPALGQLVIQPDGHILGGGIANQKIIFARFDSDGSLDSAFGMGGIVVTDLQGNGGGVREMIQQPDGKLLIVPYLYAGSGTMMVLRFNPDGTPDASFGTAGTASIAIDSGAASAYSLALGPDGKILVAGRAARPPLSPVQSGGSDAVVIRLTSTGQLDTGFADQGVLRAWPAGPFNSSNPPEGVLNPLVRLLPGGRFLLAGMEPVLTNEYLILVDRYLPDGTPDLSFGPNARMTVDLGNGGTYGLLSAMTIQPDGAPLIYTGAGDEYCHPAEAVVRLVPQGLSVHVIDAAAPVVSLSAPDSSPEAASFSIGLSASDPDGDGIKQWIVNWGDGKVQVVSGDTSSLTHSYPDGPASMTVRVSAIDGDGSITRATSTIAVTNVPPTLSVGGAPEVDEGSSYSLQFNASDPGLDTISGWKIDWGDGVVQTYAGTASSAPHNYEQNGHFTILVSATDEDGTYTAAPLSVFVKNVPPTIDPLTPPSCRRRRQIAFCVDASGCRAGRFYGNHRLG